MYTGIQNMVDLGCVNMEHTRERELLRWSTDHLHKLSCLPQEGWVHQQ